MAATSLISGERSNRTTPAMPHIVTPKRRACRGAGRIPLDAGFNSKSAGLADQRITVLDFDALT
jgi:hypothetical protein